MIGAAVDFALKNRFLILAMAIVLFVWGGISFHQLPVEAYPDVANNYVEVITQWPGISAEQIEQHRGFAVGGHHRIDRHHRRSDVRDIADPHRHSARGCLHHYVGNLVRRASLPAHQSQFQFVVSRETLRFYSLKNCLKTLFRSGWTNFTLMYGGRHVYREVWKQAQSYMPYLKKVEHGHYERDELRSDDSLRAEYEKQCPAPRIRVISTVSPSRDFGAPVLPTV